MRLEIIAIATLMESALVVTLSALFVILRYWIKKTTLFVSADESIIAKAIILSSEQTGMVINNHVKMKFLVQVMPEKGRNFVVEMKELFTASDIATVKNGITIHVKYNPANTQQISLV